MGSTTIPSTSSSPTSSARPTSCVARSRARTATPASRGSRAATWASRASRTSPWVPACTAVLRPESATLGDSGVLPCKVELSRFMGSYQNYHVRVGETMVKITDFNPKNKRIYAEGENAFVRFATDDVHVI
ncbi:MAG: TOBE domain-containing protein [Atopobiaceae bacterium]|nr:TOBE domain-containing protein [Atopobiaceae bacterium]